jgi:hypothetical protein
MDSDALREALADAYEAGCRAVHENYQEDNDPDFSEAASDYVAGLKLPPASTGEAMERRERYARIIDPSSWRVMDGYLADMLRKYKGQDVGYDPEQFKHKESLAIVDALIASDALTAPTIDSRDLCEGNANLTAPTRVAATVEDMGPSRRRFPAGTGEGWRTVPNQPTREMWAAMGDALFGYKQRHHDKVAADVWNAALAASPPPEVNRLDADTIRTSPTTGVRTYWETGPDGEPQLVNEPITLPDNSAPGGEVEQGAIERLTDAEERLARLTADFNDLLAERAHWKGVATQRNELLAEEVAWKETAEAKVTEQAEEIERLNRAADMIAKEREGWKASQGEWRTLALREGDRADEAAVERDAAEAERDALAKRVEAGAHALDKAADQFAFYADAHAKKGTKDATAKAMTNHGCALACAKASRILASQPDAEGE